MNQDHEISNDAILEPLQLTETTELCLGNVKSQEILSCMFCDFSTRDEEKLILHHLYMEHRTVISDVNEIKDLSHYLNYWKHEFEGTHTQLSVNFKRIFKH